MRFSPGAPAQATAECKPLPSPGGTTAGRRPQVSILEAQVSVQFIRVGAGSRTARLRQISVQGPRAASLLVPAAKCVPAILMRDASRPQLARLQGNATSLPTPKGHRQSATHRFRITRHSPVPRLANCDKGKDKVTWAPHTARTLAGLQFADSGLRTFGLDDGRIHTESIAMWFNEVQLVPILMSTVPVVYEEWHELSRPCSTSSQRGQHQPRQGKQILVVRPSRTRQVIAANSQKWTELRPVRIRATASSFAASAHARLGPVPNPNQILN